MLSDRKKIFIYLIPSIDAGYEKNICVPAEDNISSHSHFLSFPLIAQDKVIDSLNALLKAEKEDTGKANTLNEHSYEFFDKDNHKALAYGTQALKLGQALNFRKGMATAYRRMGYACALLNNYNEAIKNYQSAIPLWKEINDQRHLALTYEDMANQ